MFVCLFVLITGYSLLQAPPREWIFACTAVCTPALRAVVLRLREDLTCMLRICLYRREYIEGERRGIGNVSLRWWRKPECPERITSQPQVTDNLLTFGWLHWWESHWVTVAPIHWGLMGSELKLTPRDMATDQRQDGDSNSQPLAELTFSLTAAGKLSPRF